MLRVWQCGLVKPLQNGVKMAFEKQLLPAMEKATQEMLKQMHASISAGLAETARAAGSASSPTIQSLQAALTQVILALSLTSASSSCCIRYGSTMASELSLREYGVLYRRMFVAPRGLPQAQHFAAEIFVGSVF